MSFFKKILSNLPEVQGPTQKRLSFKQKVKWTLIILVAFFGLGLIPLYGLGANELAQFEYLSIILGAQFGSLLSLGIGPLVTASIVLQLLNGSGLINFDLTTSDGKRTFHGLQKILGIFFVIFEAIIYVMMGGLAPAPGLESSTFFVVQLALIGQLILGGIIIMGMAEIVDKWGFGQGISIFIAAGVSSQIIIRAFSPLTSTGLLAFGSSQPAIGTIWVLFASLMNGDTIGASIALSTIIGTIIVFVMAVYAQAMKVEIPLSFGRIRGHGIRWPLNFLYTSNIPVILVAALMANVQLWARLLQNWGFPILGTFAGGQPVSGFVVWMFSPNLVERVITGAFVPQDILQAFVYVLFFVVGSVIFSFFWVQTSGMDAKSQAKQIMSSGLQIPGFRRDQRVLESILNRYIMPLTVMGGALVGILAASADLLGALSRGTGILLAVMIIYKLYEEIAKQHMMDMHPAMRKFME
ncbi:MAG: preprotein translocase subunit SecY [archaeon]